MEVAGREVTSGIFNTRKGGTRSKPYFWGIKGQKEARTTPDEASLVRLYPLPPPVPISINIYNKYIKRSGKTQGKRAKEALLWLRTEE
jgi:hypothetical protein